MLRRLHKDKNAPSAPLSPRHSPRQMSPRTSLSARHIERGHQLAASLQQNSSVYGHVHANSEVVSLLNENAALESKNQKLAQQIEDLENVHRRLWERGRHPASPTSKGLRTFATEAQQQLEHERQTAEAHRLEASENLREALQARSDAFVALAQLHEANQALEADKSALKEWHVNGASDMSRRMGELQSHLRQEQERCALLTRDLEHLNAARSTDVGRLLGEIEGVRREAGMQLERQHEECASLKAELDAAHFELADLSSTSAHEQAALRDGVRKQQVAVTDAREAAAGAQVVMNAQLARLTHELGRTQGENERLRVQLEEARDNYARLAQRGRETEERLTHEMGRLNAVVERLGGERAEDRKVMVERLETLSREKEETVGELSSRLQRTGREKDDEIKGLKAEIERMRRLQKKVFDGGGVKPGKERMHLYWESLKNANAREDAISWRTDHDDSPLSRQIALEHQLETQRLNLEGIHARNEERQRREEEEQRAYMREAGRSKAIGTCVSIEPVMPPPAGAMGGGGGGAALAWS